MAQAPFPSRRSFLKASTGAAAAVPLGRVAFPGGAWSGGSGAIRIGMIGAGGRCTGAAVDALAAGPDVRLVAVCDLFPDRVKGALENLRAQYPEQVDVPPGRQFVGFDGAAQVIAASDVVLIACASKFHPIYAKAALEAGKHVFVEKPHGVDPRGMHTMREAVDLAKAEGLSLVSGLQSRYSPAFREGVERIHAGEIGDVTGLEENFIRGPYRLEARQPDDTEMSFQYRNWYHFSWLSGDDVVQSLVHNLDRARAVMGEAVPEWCYGMGGRSSMFTEQMGDVFDHHAVTYAFPGNVRVYAHCRTQTGCWNNANGYVWASRGHAVITDNSYALFDQDGKRIGRGSGPGSPYRHEQAALIQSVRDGRSLVNDYMVDSTRMTVMGQIACYTGQSVSWEQVRDSQASFGPPSGDFDTEPPKRPGEDGLYPLSVPGQTRSL